MRLIKTVSVVFVCYLCFISVIYGVSQHLTIETSGKILTPPQLLADPPSIDWGNVSLGAPVYRSIDLTNVGDEPLTNLTMTTSSNVGLTNWTLTWDAEGKTIDPQQTLPVAFTLIIYNYTSTDFSFKTSIYGEP